MTDNYDNKCLGVFTMRASMVNIISIASFSFGLLSVFLQLSVVIGLIQPFLYGNFFVTFSKLEMGIIILIVISSVLALSLGSVAITQSKCSDNRKYKRFAIIGMVCGIEFILVLITYFIIKRFFITYA